MVKRGGKARITTHPSQFAEPTKISRKRQVSIEKYERALVVFESVTSNAALKQLNAKGIEFTQEGFRSFAKIGTDTLYGEKDLFKRLQTKLQAVRDGRWSKRSPPGSGHRQKYDDLLNKYNELSAVYEACRIDNANLIRLLEIERAKSRR